MLLASAVIMHSLSASPSGDFTTTTTFLGISSEDEEETFEMFLMAPECSL